MAPPTLPGSDQSQDDAQWRSAGDRIQTLLDASSSGGAVARERAEQLVREVTDLYGAALQRILRIAAAADPAVVTAFTRDDLVASLLIVHDLHPHSVEQRVADALDSVRPYLGSHGGDVHLLGVDGDPDNLTVRLQFSGSCKSCPSSAVTLELAVEDAVRAAAPEIATIEVVAAGKDSVAAVIPAESLLDRVHTNGHRAQDEHKAHSAREEQMGHRSAWHPVPELADLDDGEVGGFLIADTPALACRIGADVFAYRDRCPCCALSLAGARLDGAVLRCPRCGAGFDAVHAGAGLDSDSHLEPLPVLTRDGVLAMALKQAVPS